MADVAARKIKDEIDSMIETLDKTCIRKMQGDMYRCAAVCCDDIDKSTSLVQMCVQSCSNRIEKAQNFLQRELNDYQDRVQRCVLQCQDKIKDKITPTTTDTEISRFQGEFEQCVVKCGDTHIKLLPALQKKIISVLESERYPYN